MDKEINNHKKADLAKVVCDCLTCPERGDRDRCYFGPFACKSCEFYELYKRKDEDN